MANLLPIDFSQISTYITLAVILILSVVLCMLAYRLMNVVPAKWLCDYDEEPDESLFGTRYIFKQSGIYTSALFAIFNLGIFAFFGYSFYTIFFLLISYTMLLITMSDFKYTIIPDQFTIALAVLCVALAITDLFTQQIFIKEWWSIPLGAVCGGGSLMLINLFSIVILKKNGMGFGDVKLRVGGRRGCKLFAYVDTHQKTTLRRRLDGDDTANFALLVNHRRPRLQALGVRVHLAWGRHGGRRQHARP